ncbi:response regulator [Dyadobacter aurulentus]|uniref:response regulator n=1 Tax=Dyadobacter sp. UC 10 TaxID=2605428 RepID=UPI0011F2B647|nr:response regulator [Dyadobacter sp. UC 10]KAA0989081.1 response regulator [Dyadobacter sp. UC 10]
MRPRINILLVDDDLDDQEILATIMKDSFDHAEFTFANDGMHALYQLKGESFVPDIIFADINMPRMNGMEFLMEFRKMQHLAEVPVFMYSTSDEQEIVNQCRSLGANGFVKKYADTDQIKSAFQKIIQNITSRH